MKLHRIYAIILRHYYNLLHNIDQMSELFYWPAIDLLIWGLTSLYIKQYTPHGSSVVLMLITGIVFWTVIWRAQREITTALLEELWNKNLINIFVSPLTFSEWIVSIFIISFVKTAISFIFMCLLAIFLYGVNFSIYGMYLLILILLILLFAWSVAFFVSGIILRYGTRVQTLAYSLIVIFSPFSAVYYPLSILPLWAQKVAIFIPTSYVFEGMRSILSKGRIDPMNLYTSLFINIIYLVISLVYIKKSFDKVLQKGLVKVY